MTITRERADTLATSAVAGTMIGILTVVFVISFSAIIFSGPLAPLLAKGIGVGLFSAVMIAFVVALTASYRGTIAIPQSSMAAILALAAAGVAQSLPPASPATLLYPTVLATLALASVTAGLVFLGLGQLRLSVLVRCIPYPVVGGFLAATGWLLTIGALRLMAGTPITTDALSVLLQTDVLIAWVPGVLLGLTLLFVSRCRLHPAFLLVTLVAAALLFYLVTGFMHVSITESARRGWLLGPFPDQEFWRAIEPGVLLQADWTAAFGQFTTILTAVVLGALSVLLNASGIELATRRDIDLDRELKSAGAANFVAAAGGGIIGYQTLSLSTLSHRLNADHRIAGIMVAAVNALVLFAGASLFSYIPKFVFGGVIVFLGFDFLFTWLHEQRSRLPVVDYLIVVMIFIVAASVGFLEGIAVGIAAGIVLFIVSYSRISIVKHQLSGSSFRSKVDRSERQNEHLRERGDQLLILELQGFIFFATSHRLLQKVRARADDNVSRIRFVVIDFRHVHGLDSSAVLSFVKLHHLAQRDGFVMVLTALSPPIRRQFQRSDLPLDEDGAGPTFVDLDDGVEWCEDLILQSDAVDSVTQPIPLETLLQQEGQPHVSAERLLDYFDRRELTPGDILIHQGETAKDLFFIESGWVTAYLERNDGSRIRLRSMSAGAILGEMGVYTGGPRTASVVANQACIIHCLTGDALQRMEKEQPALVAQFHRFVARRLASRLADTNQVLYDVLT